jgi:hypothetical protein
MSKAECAKHYLPVVVSAAARNAFTVLGAVDAGYGLAVHNPLNVCLGASMASANAIAGELSSRHWQEQEKLEAARIGFRRGILAAGQVMTAPLNGDSTREQILVKIDMSNPDQIIYRSLDGAKEVRAQDFEDLFDNDPIHLIRQTAAMLNKSRKGKTLKEKEVEILRRATALLAFAPGLKDAFLCDEGQSQIPELQAVVAKYEAQYSPKNPS